ncbi:hypothetical protein LTR33_019062, partial [Friedmanniomyces endolithicus]
VSPDHLARPRRPLDYGSLQSALLSRWRARPGMPCHGCEAPRFFVPRLLSVPQPPADQHYKSAVAGDALITFEWTYAEGRQRADDETFAWKVSTKYQREQRPETKSWQFWTPRSHTLNGIRSILRHKPLLRTCTNTTSTRSTSTDPNRSPANPNTTTRSGPNQHTRRPSLRSLPPPTPQLHPHDRRALRHGPTPRQLPPPARPRPQPLHLPRARRLPLGMRKAIRALRPPRR